MEGVAVRLSYRFGGPNILHADLMEAKQGRAFWTLSADIPLDADEGETTFVLDRSYQVLVV